MSSAVRETLTAYVAGRVKADHVVTVVTAAYYRNGGGRRREALRPVLDVIERASPGVVELAGDLRARGSAFGRGGGRFPSHVSPACLRRSGPIWARVSLAGLPALFGPWFRASAC